MEYKQGSSDKKVHVHTTPDDWSDEHSNFRQPHTAYSQQTPRSPYAAPSQQAPQMSQKLGGLVGRSICLVAGLALTLIGIPMLILPGPGLLTLATGAALMGAGLAPSADVRVMRC